MPCITHATTIRPPIFAFEIGTWSFANLDVSLQSPLASLSFFFYFFSFISITLKTRRPSCAYHSQVRSFINSIITSSSRVTPIVPLSLAPIMHSLSLFFLFFFFFLLSFSFLCFVRVTIQYLFTRYTCTNCETASLGLWRITVSRSIYDSDCSQSAIALYGTFARSLRQHQRYHVWW